MKKHLSLTCFLSFFLASNLFPSQLKGIVKDINNQPIESVKIIIKERDTILFSDKNGMFVIPVHPEERELVITFESDNFYPLTKRIKINRGKKTIEILLIPREHLKEEISVTALNIKEESVSVPTAESVISDLEIKEKISENVVSALLETPGVHFIGKGGFSITPSIRGLARRRVLILLDGARVTSDRRAGSSASFVPPEMVKRIEVIRSASSVLYGSDAIGGVVHVMTRKTGETDIEKNTINLNLNSINQRVNTGVSFNQKFGKAK